MAQKRFVIDVRRDAWLRRPSRLRWFVLIVGVIFAMALPKAIGAAEDGGTSSALAGAAVILALAAPYLYFAGRIARSGIWLGADGIVIRGPFRTRRISGSSAVSFGPGVQPGAGNGTPCPILTRADGSEVGVWALGIESLVWNFGGSLEEMRPLCDELNALLEELYPGHPLPRSGGPEVQTLVQASPGGGAGIR
jgi:hypothetical protein